MTDARKPNEFVETIRTVVYALLIALVLRVLLFQPFTIPSESMQPGLLVGDYIVVTKFDYGWTRNSLPFRPPVIPGRLVPRAVERGDVVVFKRTADFKEDVIKRVIGLPGDRVQVSDGAVSLNGRPLARVLEGFSADPGDPGLRVARARETSGRHTYVTLDRGPGHPGDDTEVFVVPEGHYFLMGDNRDNSADSRFPVGQGMGMVPADNVIGKARFVLASWQPGASILKPWTWVRLRNRFFVPID